MTCDDAAREILNERKDIFDIIMGWSLLQPFYPLYKKHREGLLYLFFGGITFFLSMAIFILLNKVWNANPLIANIASWIFGVTFSFYTTRGWVFRARENGVANILRQFMKFCVTRVASLSLQEILLYIFVTALGYGSLQVKICTEVLAIVLNYLASKFLIFAGR